MEYKKNEQIRVLQVLGSLDMGGAESRIMDVFRQIDRQKIQFDFLIFQQGEQIYESEAIALGAHVIKCYMPKLGNILSHIAAVRKVIRDGNYDAVHAHTSYHSGLILYAAWLEHVPVRIVHSRTTGSKRATGFKQKLMISVGRALIARFATKQLAISREAGNYLFGEASFEVLPNAINVPEYQSIDLQEVSDLQQELNIRDNFIVIGQIGRFEQMKNHRFTLKWFEQFRKTHNDAILLLIGDGPLRSEMEQFAKHLGIWESVRFTGVRRDVPVLLYLFHVMIFPSVFEGLGGVLLEAQAAGVPSVISDSLPAETDLGLNLIYRCSLKDSFDIWNHAVENMKKFKCNDKQLILDAFNAHGYSLDHEIQRLIEIYSGAC